LTGLDNFQQELRRYLADLIERLTGLAYPTLPAGEA
jgi:hypothetical protein